ncbi:MAG: DinB family protein [Chloroflexi bacterium]|nr:DinB family protein [Chloroflexota bacterium]
MSPELRSKKIESYGDGHAALVKALKEFPKEMWRWRDPHGCWSIHELVVHITDSEANSYIRCRRFIAEPGESLMAYDENQWASALDYHTQDTDDALEMFKWLRRRSYTLITSLPEAVLRYKAFMFEQAPRPNDICRQSTHRIARPAPSR